MSFSARQWRQWRLSVWKPEMPGSKKVPAGAGTFWQSGLFCKAIRTAAFFCFILQGMA